MRHDTQRARHRLERRESPLSPASSVWAAVAIHAARRPSAQSDAMLAECRCPTDCIRDHENE
jgi:hypothetical protein